MNEKKTKEETLHFINGQKINPIPIKFKDKQPALKWTIYQKEIFPIEYYDKYFSDTAEYNIGFVCGEISDNLVVLDFDSEEAYKQFYPEFSQLELETTVVKTAKGIHVYFKTEYPLDYLQIIDDKEREVMSLRGNGHYVVAPPSIHPDGEQYFFISNNGIKRLKDIDLKQELKEKAEKLGYRIKGFDKLINIENLLKGCSEGNRDNNLLKLITLCRKIGKTEDESLKICGVWNKKCEPPLIDSDIRYKIRYHYNRTEPYNYQYDRGISKLDITPELKLIQKEKEQSGEWQDNFNSPDLLMKIKNELDKDHIGDDRNKLFLLCSALSGRLPPYYRFSSALIGDSSEGKDNMWNTISRYLPSEWYLEANKITGSCIEDDIDNVDIIYFKEVNQRGMNYQIIDHLKALVEDGITVMKKDVKSNFKETINKQLPRKVGIYSTTSNIYDEELSNRYCIVTVKGHPSKYKAVNIRTKQMAENPELAIQALKRKNKTSWIIKGLECQGSFDIITIPNASMIEERTDTPRSQRDLKRFLNLVRVIAWLYQRQRKTEEKEGYKILYAEPEDVYNAMMIGSEIFNQSYSHLDSRSKETIYAIAQLIKERGREHQDLLEQCEEYKALKWIDRVDVQKKLHLKSTNAIKNRVKKLKELGIVREYSTKNTCFITLIDDPSIHLSTTYQMPISETFLRTTAEELYKKLLTGERQAVDTPKDGQNDRQKSILISFNDELPIIDNTIKDSNEKEEGGLERGSLYYFSKMIGKDIKREIGGDKMDCQIANCKHYVPVRGEWCKVHGEFYRLKMYGFHRNRSEPTNYAFTDSSVCGDFEPELE